MPSLPHAVRYPIPATVPPAAVDWTLDAGRAALLVHDMQSYFLAAFDHHSDPYRSLVANVRHLVDWARNAGAPILVSAQPGGQDPADRGLLTDFWGPGLPADPALEAVDPALSDVLDIEPPAVRLRKQRYSATVGTGLLESLREAGRDQLVITGVYTGIGCLSTALDAFMADVQPFLVIDAVADFTESDHLAAAEFVARRCGRVIRTADLGSAVLAVSRPESAAGAAGATGATGAADAADASATRDWESFLLAQVRDLVGDPGLAPAADDDLTDHGLDSVRSLALLDRIERAGGHVAMIDLLTDPTLRGLSGAIRAQQAESVASTQS